MENSKTVHTIMMGTFGRAKISPKQALHCTAESIKQAQSSNNKTKQLQNDAVKVHQLSMLAV